MIKEITLDTQSDSNYYLVSFNTTNFKISKSANKLSQVIKYLSSQCDNLIII